MFNFSQHILHWYEQHGRKDLPWQQSPTPYRVWVSEIMLQQTQVNTVIPYYLRFIQTFPNIQSLATAENDQIMQHWAGLGYYARARNLHKAAIIIHQQYQGRFPDNLTDIQALPGIGRSTAGAILSLAMQQHASILDGNVKRVLARFFAIDGWTGTTVVLKQLWLHAEQLTPQDNVQKYNQAMMDMGAILCTRSKPQCNQCPLQTHCQAYISGMPTQWPHKKPKKIIPTKHTHMLVITNKIGQLYLYKRPPVGIWGGLWSLPEIDNMSELDQWAQKNDILIHSELEKWPQRRHTFSHYHLDISPIQLNAESYSNSIRDTELGNWFTLAHIQQKGLAKPISDILNQLQTGQYYEPNDSLH